MHRGRPFPQGGWRALNPTGGAESEDTGIRTFARSFWIEASPERDSLRLRSREHYAPLEVREH
eukprot:15274703-Alexandrium_andersonii.AAC.1